MAARFPFQARAFAAEEGRTVGVLLTDLLADLVRDRKAFYKARRRALARLWHGLDFQWKAPSDRHSVHER